MKRLILSIGFLAVALLAAAPAHADTVQIQFSGVNLIFSAGTGLCDAGGCSAAPFASFNFGSSDPLNTMTFINTTTNTTLGTLVNPPSTLATDFQIPIAALPAPGSSTSGGGGFWDLASNGGGWGLATNIVTWSVDIGGSGSFLFTGGGSLVFAQNLPFAVFINPNQPLTFTFSCNNFAFDASGNGTCSGTGEISGTLPEPGTLMLLGSALLGLAGLRRKLS